MAQGDQGNPLSTEPVSPNEIKGMITKLRTRAEVYRLHGPTGDSFLPDSAAELVERVYHRLCFVEGQRDGAIEAAAHIERIEALNAELREALATADDAIREMFRYYDGGETRGSYDGKPERNQLRKAGYAVRAALASGTPTTEGEK